MLLGANSFNMYNMTGSLGFGNTFGMSNMFGNCGLLGGGFGSSIFGSGFGMSTFMDCDGNINYDAMAGFAIGNALMNVTGLGISYAMTNAGGIIKTQKDTASDLNDKLEKLNDERATIISDSGTTAEAILGYKKENSTEYNAWNTTNQEYTEKNNEVENGKIDYENNKTTLEQVNRDLAGATGEVKTILEAQQQALSIKVSKYEDLVKERDDLKKRP